MLQHISFIIPNVMDFINSLIKIINTNEKVDIFEDPSCEGSSEYGFLAFPKTE